ncbi:MAG: HK97 family phage prohead protease [Gammaproteobacteria bacterium]|nr:HK97 family phage prohead protease [Gammaproteobacteria bacterium]
MRKKMFKPNTSQIKDETGKSIEIEHKQFAIDDIKIIDSEGFLTIEGYANSKNKADRYGDIPTVYSVKRNFVYDLTEFLKNPVALINHHNNTSSVVGSFQPKLGGYVTEDDIGLKFKLVFTNSDLPEIKHARTVYSEGHARALSIGGNWYHEDEENPAHLTLAKIYEISLVGVGADPNALTTKETPAGKENGEARNLQDGIAIIVESIKAGQVLTQAEKDQLNAIVDNVIEKGEKTEGEILQDVCDAIKE